MKKSQKERVLEWLQERGEEGIKSFEGYANYIPRLATRIWELKNDGHNIITKRVPNSQEVRYILVPKLEAPRLEAPKLQEKATQESMNLDIPFG